VGATMPRLADVVAVAWSPATAALQMPSLEVR